jgi:hypothetical protein
MTGQLIIVSFYAEKPRAVRELFNALIHRAFSEPMAGFTVMLPAY